MQCLGFFLYLVVGLVYCLKYNVGRFNYVQNNESNLKLYFARSFEEKLVTRQKIKINLASSLQDQENIKYP